MQSSTIEKYGEVAVCPDEINELSSLTKEERIFIYYMSNAVKPFNHIYREQNNRNNVKIIEMFNFLYENVKILNNNNLINPNILKDITNYLIYLLANSGVHDHREDKRKSFDELKLYSLNRNDIETLLKIFSIDKYNEYKDLLDFLYDPSIDNIQVVDGSIDKSGGGYYGKGFTDEHYEKIDPKDRNINSYYEIDNSGNIIIRRYSTTDKYAKQLTETVKWLKLAYKISKESPEIFDINTTESIEYLIKYFESGDEEMFKEHCKKWLKSNSRIQYTMGFIEVYREPKNIIGEAGGEITIRPINIEKLNPVLLKLESGLPIDDNYRRNVTTSTLNVSLNKIIYAAGSYGPTAHVAAYCLPNYDDIRAEYGSKQVIYIESNKKILSDPELYEKFRTTKGREFHENYDNNDEIEKDMWDLQVLLHETVGHASGKLHKKILTNDDIINLKSGGYTESDLNKEIEVTESLYNMLVPTEKSSLEEMRAEINALYMSTFEIDTLEENNMYKNWLKVLGREQLLEQCIIAMTGTALRRYLQQAKNFKEVNGAHARANTCITNFMINKGGIALNSEDIIVNDEKYTLYEIVVLDLNKALESIKELVGIVQTLKSTGDGTNIRKLFETYTKYPITIEEGNKIRDNLERNRNKVTGGLKTRLRLFNKFSPVVDDSGNVIDATYKHYDNIFDQMSDLE